MTQRQRLRAAKIALAGRLLSLDSPLRKEFGNRAVNDIFPADANTAIQVATTNHSPRAISS